MTTERAATPRWEPTWRRVVASSVVLFVVILAFLVGRERAGADPGLARNATPVPRSAPPAAQQQQQTPGIDPNADPNDPFGQQTDPSIDPNSGTGGSDDNFGNAVPDDSGGSDDFGDQSESGGTQQFDPPSTHVS
jgi:hypothetical protein